MRNPGQPFFGLESVIVHPKGGKTDARPLVGHWAIVLVPGSWSIGPFEVMEGIHPQKLISKVITLWQFQIAI